MKAEEKELKQRRMRMWGKTEALISDIDYVVQSTPVGGGDERAGTDRPFIKRWSKRE